jgi:hypothetical protein
MHEMNTVHLVTNCVCKKGYLCGCHVCSGMRRTMFGRHGRSSMCWEQSQGMIPQVGGGVFFAL